MSANMIWMRTGARDDPHHVGRTEAVFSSFVATMFALACAAGLPTGNAPKS